MKEEKTLYQIGKEKLKIIDELIKILKNKGKDVSKYKETRDKLYLRLEDDTILCIDSNPYGGRLEAPEINYIMLDENRKRVNNSLDEFIKELQALATIKKGKSR